MDRIVYLGHATVLVEMGGTAILTDPVLERRVGHIRRRAPLPDVEALPPLAGIVISHAHADHLHRASLRRVANSLPVLVPRGCGRLLRGCGADEILEVEAGQRRSIGTIQLEAVPALHDGRRVPLGRPLAALGYLMEGCVRVYFAGDTDLFDGMSALAGRVDVALLPIWGWGGRLPPGHLNPTSAGQAVSLIRPRIAIPIHWGTLQSVGAPRSAVSLAPARAFAAAVAELGLGTEVRILMPGQSLELDALVAS